MAEHVQGETDPGDLTQPADQLVHGLVRPRPPGGFVEQVHEHVVGVALGNM